MDVRNQVRIGNVSLAAALLSLGAQLVDAECDQHRQFHFHLQGEQLPAALAAIMFGGYAGLNLLEVVRLDNSCFSVALGTVTVTESKTQFRERTLPLIQPVREYAAKLVADGGPFMAKQDGSAADHHTIGRSLRRVLDQAYKRTGNEAYRQADPKDMRKTFANLCVIAGVPESAFGAYLGHRPQSMTARVYADFGQMDYLKREVVTRLESYLAEQGAAAEVVAIQA